MADKNLDQQFSNSCVTHDYPCTVGDKFIDPCLCKNYYLCEHTTSIIQQSCSDGTLFDHVTNNCELDSNVAIINKRCDQYKPWERCQDDKENVPDIPALIKRCTGISPTPGTTPATPGPTDAQTESGVNGGAIAGAVIAVLLIIAIVVIIFIVFKKRGKPVSHYLSFLTLKKQVENPQYDNQDETYAEINDGMGAPVYNDTMKGGPGSSPKVPDRPPFTLSPALNVNQDSNKIKGRYGHEEVAYDNPGYTPSKDDDDVIQGSVSINVSHAPPYPGSLKTEDEADRLSSYSGLEESTLEVPSNKPYTPLSVYTRGPNPNASPSSAGGILQLHDNEYQVPKPIPEYYELSSGSNSVS